MAKEKHSEKQRALLKNVANARKVKDGAYENLIKSAKKAREAGVSVVDIADKAGVTRQAVYVWLENDF